MVRPVDFVFNEQTAQDNEFQNELTDQNPTELALKEFDQAVKSFQSVGVEVLIVEKDSELAAMPDAVFPNNWFGTDSEGNVHIFPMKTLNRRAETEQLDQVLGLLEDAGFEVNAELDWTDKLGENAILEGTGSLILDRVNHVVYAAISERTQPEAVKKFAAEMGYEPVLFHTQSSKGFPYYHTNVVMSIGTNLAVVCLDCIPDEKERALVQSKLSTFHTVVEISIEQLEQGFCGNLLQVKESNGNAITVLSSTAYQYLSEAQKAELKTFGNLLPISIPTIEHVGGGSIRCMMAEIFCPKSS